MMKSHIYILLFILTLLPHPSATAAPTGEIRWHNESVDTTEVNRILIKATDLCATSPNQLVEFIGKEFLGKPYKAATLEGEPEMLTVNLDELDCTTYIENVAALALTVENNKCSWIDFAEILRDLRYRGGTVDGYASRMHYISDWIVNNTHRGYIREVTDRIPQSDSFIKTIDYMSKHPGAYPALADKATLDKIKDMEVGYRSHRFPYIKSARVGAKPVISALKAGDIIAFTSRTEGLDVSHLGIIVMENSVPHLMHASSKEGKVVIDKLPLTEYLRKSPQLTGIRVIRLQQQ